MGESTAASARSSSDIFSINFGLKNYSHSHKVFLSFADVHGGPHERRLLNDLLEHYNTLERPVYNESEPLELLFGLTLQQIIDVVSIYFSSRSFVKRGSKK